MMLDWLADFVGNVLAKLFGSANPKALKRIEPYVRAINALESRMMHLSDAGMRETSETLRRRVTDGESLDEVLPEAFALAREAAKRALGQRHYDVQLVGAIVLHTGRVAEMITGEGKTLVATCPAYLNTLAAGGVHVVTVNDYLARRDAAWNRPVFDLLGVTVGCIQSSMSSSERHPEYACHITYGTNNEFGFDYLRDNMKMSLRDQVQRRRDFAIVDEVDSVLIDEARTPLIISGDAAEALERYDEADRVAKMLQGLGKEEPQYHTELDGVMVSGLKEHELDELIARSTGIDYFFSEKHHTVNLTERGLHRAAELLDGVQSADDMYRTGNWPHYIENALKANALYQREKDYLVTEGGEVVIVDEFTGRMMEGRRWSDGLHQAVEAKEGLEVREETQTLATITFQNFFRLYAKLSGMTGTAMTEAKEFNKIYKLNCVSIPPNRPLRRVSHPDVIYSEVPAKMRAAVEEIARENRCGRPVLVGTTSVEKSEELSRMLKQRGVPHDVLNAKQHEREADIVAHAGELGHVCVATNMAGRGTDIVLGRFKPETLLEHWKKNGLAPKHLKADDPNLADRLTDFWVEAFFEEDEKVLQEVQALDMEGKRDRLVQEWTNSGSTVLPFNLCASIAQLGGLHVVATERHEARRIDNQLRGRTGRQGDPGTSRFFLSLDDDLMRIFAKDWVKKFLARLGLVGDQFLESPMVSRQIEKAQLRVEEHNFGIRKRLIEYDEVMDEQRTLIYGMRQQILKAGEKARAGEADAEEAGREIKDKILDMSRDVIRQAVTEIVFPPAPEPMPMHARAGQVAEYLQNRFGVTVSPVAIVGIDLTDLDPGEYHRILNDRIQEAYEDRPPRKDVDIDLIPADVADAIDRIVYDDASGKSNEERLRALIEWAQKEYRVAPGERDLIARVEEHLQDMPVRDLDLIAPDELTDRLYELVLPVVGKGGKDLPRENLLLLMDDLVIGAVDRFVYGEEAGSLPQRAENLAAWLKDVWGVVSDPAKLVGLKGRNLRTETLDEVLVRQPDEVQASVRRILREAYEKNQLEFTSSRIENIIRRSIQLLLNAVLFSETLPPAAPSRSRSLSSWMHRTFTVEIPSVEVLGYIREDILPDDPRRHDLEAYLNDHVVKTYAQHEEEMGAESMRELERYVLLEIIDRRWKDHLRDMDHLKEGIWLESYGGKDPKMRYKERGYEIFKEMLGALSREVAEMILKVRLTDGADLEQDLSDRWGSQVTGRGDLGGFGEQKQKDLDAAEMAGKDHSVETYRRDKRKIKRNEPCWCGSGRKYKVCHMKDDLKKER